MRISCVQMNMRFADTEYNFAHAQALIRQVFAGEHPDVILLPETWNMGFFAREGLAGLCDQDGRRTKQTFGALARELGVNIVAGSVANLKDGQPHNTAYIFNREGACVGEYDKTHLFSPMEENAYFRGGDSLCTFTLDGVPCGVIICYDLRFPELTRSLALKGIAVLFMVAQWPNARIPHMQVLTQARAIENQMFLACCNSCGANGKTRYGGSSSIIDPWGKVLAQAAAEECSITADCDLQCLEDIRSTINVFRDRRPEIYQL
ncbi:MAG: carbon-nitrogen family hydrolase [Christensenellaceae bacterium]|jgi:predicted amidohydrolase|nr:carbon-nitrogen family hydrolase [Christensenellaceae bacterium]